MTLRRAAKNDRVLFHYNGHGVPRPTPNGEFWVFNHNYTQYIPFNLFDLHDVLGSPALYIFDCSGAATVLRHFKKVMEELEDDYRKKGRRDRKSSLPLHHHSVFLAATSEGETLPVAPSLPADLFTSCLTTPIKTALRWFVRRRSLIQGITFEMLDNIPGSLLERHTPIGELQWILTAITDTIAWNVLPPDLFKELYRRDLMLSSLMRNFLLANRIMHFHGCTPVSHPHIPDTHNHHLWQSFELAMEHVLAQLPTMLSDLNQNKNGRARFPLFTPSSSIASSISLAVHNGTGMQHRRASITAGAAGMYSHASAVHGMPRSSSRGLLGNGLAHREKPRPSYRYRPNPFFHHQLTSFSIWLNMGPENRGPPEQLPTTLHILLSPPERLRTLQLLARYVQTGPSAVDLTLSVGVFPYVLRLLDKNSDDRRAFQELVFIWSKVMALDPSVCSDLMEKQRERYFIHFLQKPQPGETEPKPVYLAVALYILSVVATRYADRLGKAEAIEVCFERLNHFSPFVRRWACLCLTEVIKHGHPDATGKILMWDDLLHTLDQLASVDSFPDVRAAATSTLSAIMNGTFARLSVNESPPASNVGVSAQSAPENRYQRGCIEENVPNKMLSGSGVASMGQAQWGQNFSGGEPKILGGSGLLGYNTTRASFTLQEQRALHLIGRPISLNLDKESSTLVRREIAISLSRAVLHRESRFLRAAYSADVDGIEVTEKNLPSSDRADDRWESIYNLMWTSLSELAYDSHPVVAAIARKRYDLISDQLLEITISCDNSGESLREQTSTSPSSFPGRTSILNKSQSPDIIRQLPGAGSVNILSKFEREEWPSSNRHAHPSLRPVSSQSLHDSEGCTSSPLTSKSSTKLDWPTDSSNPPNVNIHSRNLWRRSVQSTDFYRGEFGKGRIHVRGKKGTGFDLNASSRMPRMSRFPRTNSASLMPSLATSPPEIPTLTRGVHRAGASLDMIGGVTGNESPRQGPQFQVVKGIETFMRSITQQFSFGGSSSPGTVRPSSLYGSNRDSDMRGRANTPVSPPRPPRRSQSYQILNTVDTLPSALKPALRSLNEREASKDHNSTITMGKSPLSGNSSLEKYTPHLSEAGSATLSLFEWSCALVSQVQFDAKSIDYMPEEKAIPRYARLWNKLSKSQANVPLEDSLRAFVEVPESNYVGSLEGNAFESVRELHMYVMGAGGGAITSMAFLPRDSGMGDDHLLATGDSTGSVGVYDVDSGTCHGAFGVPSPPGIPDVGISSLLCLNSFDRYTSDGSVAPTNSLSALILAGAYDGRAAVFKSDVHGKKYRIMSTFQASGKSFWSTVGTAREFRCNASHAADVSGSNESLVKATSSRDSVKSRLPPDALSDAIQQNGNGLSLSFDYGSSYLAAGGCENETVRLWDLSCERCTWQAPSVRTGSWPTALSIWAQKNPNIVLAGSSDGSINLSDTREHSARNETSLGFHKLGMHKYPIISVGTFIQGKGDTRDVIVGADIGGELIFWDPRWNGRELYSSSPSETSELARIRAHTSSVTAMAVHPSGRYVATGSTGQCVKIFGPDRTMANMMLGHETPENPLFPMKSRIPPVTSLSFQHESNTFAVGCRDSSVIIYGDPVKTLDEC